MPRRSPPISLLLGSLAPNTNLVSSLSAALEREILSGRFKSGDRLPTESELARITGVSRTVVREAVAALRASGLVETRRGAGAFVTAQAERPRVGPGMLRATLDDIVAVLELRLAVEVEAASIAAARRSESDIVDIALALEAADGASAAWPGGVAADLAFHRAIAAATHNKYFVDFIEHLGEFAFPLRHIGQATASAYRIEDDNERMNAEHRAIFAAIRRCDGVLASAEMRRHLSVSRARYKAMSEETGEWS